MGWKSKTAGGALALALGVVTAWEGFEPEVYLDPVGIPTVCYGHVVNNNLPVGTKFSTEACNDLLHSDLIVASNAVDALVKVRISDNEKAAYTSFVFNVGIGNFKSSTLLRKLNSGDHIGACHELPRWVYAKGKKLRGLVNRRQAEMKLCLGEE